MQIELISKISSLFKENYLATFLLVYALSVISSIFIISNIKESKTKIELTSKDQTQEDKEESEPVALYVEISGAVNSPGVYILNNGDRLVDLVSKADGFSQQASEEWLAKAINLSSPLKDSQKIYIPFKWDPYEEVSKLEPVPLVKELVASTVVSESSTESGSVTSQNETSQNTSKVNVNTASNEELDTLPGIGPTYADKIIQNRPYADYAEMKSKSGIVSSTLEKIKDLISY